MGNRVKRDLKMENEECRMKNKKIPKVQKVAVEGHPATLELRDSSLFSPIDIRVMDRHKIFRMR